MNSTNQPTNPINQNGQNTPNSQNNQINPNNQMSPKEIEPVHYTIQHIEMPNESVKPVVPQEKVVYTYDDSSEYSSYSSCMEWSDSTEDLIDMLDEQPDHLWDLSSDSEC